MIDNHTSDNLGKVLSICEDIQQLQNNTKRRVATYQAVIIVLSILSFVLFLKLLL